ncbi:head decoration protein [Aurantimonas sp. MSK8Z-1]|uniref:head decoration protein n=1 Tax=Mangrovibrevibacter kandeliae TaxID=2968473 RepID=UPI0021186DDA|nr:head decoration protein [Aurantimonas sp. MSK8Z-1]MCW4114749.1 head decoration protein [Aurantimonas sp. MSK8Z-1]
MSTVLTEDRFSGAAHYIVSEAAGMYRSREQGVVASGSGVLKPGAVLGKVTASGKFKPLAPGASDGTQTAAAILWEGCDATSGDVRRTLTVRDTEVHADVLVWAAGVTDAQKTAAMASLAAVGIIGR